MHIVDHAAGIPKYRSEAVTNFPLAEGIEALRSLWRLPLQEGQGPRDF